MPEYIVTSPLHHDGKPVAVGDTVTMDAKDAKPLLAKNVLAASKAAVAGYDSWTVPNLKALLDERQVSYDAAAKKADLVALAQSLGPQGSGEEEN